MDKAKQMRDMRCVLEPFIDKAKQIIKDMRCQAFFSLKESSKNGEALCAYSIF